MGLSGSHFKLIYHDDIVYKSWIDSYFIIVHKGVLVITQGCIEVSEQVLYIRLID